MSRDVINLEAERARRVEHPSRIAKLAFHTGRLITRGLEHVGLLDVRDEWDRSPRATRGLGYGSLLGAGAIAGVGAFIALTGGGPFAAEADRQVDRMADIQAGVNACVEEKIELAGTDGATADALSGYEAACEETEDPEGVLQP